MIPDEIQLHGLIENVPNLMKMVQDLHPEKKFWILIRIETTPDLIESYQDLER